uniref:NACHT C-terminal helical domain 2-containing protein n=1 Tax=Desertifilum tharense IPPAS B-1220 TaxID=1781255 RepID=A0ACD5GUU2_9CYAN
MVNQGERSRKASEAGIRYALTALTNKAQSREDLAKEVQLSRSTVMKFFSGKPVDYPNFVNICQALDLDWQEIAIGEEKVHNNSAENLAIEAIIQQARLDCQAQIQYQCGTLRMLDISRAIALTDIFTEVNVLEQLNSQQWRDMSELVKDFNPILNRFDRLGLSKVRQARVCGLDALSRYRKLMILGKPGAGKTTFLQHIAIQCSEGKFEPRRVPLFIKLKEFAEDAHDKGEFNLLKYLIQNLSISKIKPEIAHQLIETGKTVILLDGLDEVAEFDSERVVREIRRVTRYHQNYFAITCRIAASSHQFQEFTDVEVADFNSEQVKSFSQKWFVAVAGNDSSAGKALAAKFTNKLQSPENEAIRELSVTPILLNLTCLVFHANADFPSSRAKLYEQGLDILLRRWDKARGIYRDEVYLSLTLARKKQLLVQVAAIAFEKGIYFFEQSQIQQLIANYLQTLPDTLTSPDEVNLDSEVVLKSIEAQHGLLVERARRIYSFSHLTFQEYLTAQNIIDRLTLDTEKSFVRYITDRRWREVFLLVVDMIDTPDSLLQAMKQYIDWMAASDENLQQLLTWVSQKSCSVNSDCKHSATRVFYLSRARADILDLSRADSSDFAYIFDPDFQPSFDLLFDRELDRILGFTFNRMLDIRQALCRFIKIVLCYPIKQQPTFDYIFGLTFNPLYKEKIEEVCKLWRALQTLSHQLPNSKKNPEEFKQWWNINGANWTAQLRNVMIEHRNIGHDWQFNRQSQDFLEQYLNANLFLLNCLHRAHHVSPTVRKEIEETLLLPLAEIEQRASYGT